MAVISKEKELGAKTTYLQGLSFLQHCFHPSSQVYQELSSLPELTLTSAASSQLWGALKPKAHICVLLGDNLFSVNLLPSSSVCSGHCQIHLPSSGLHTAPRLHLPQSWSQRCLWFTGYQWLGPDCGLQAGQPWILLSKRTNSFLNTSLLFLLWFRIHLPKLFPL